jgi:DNA-directed RNA polymerase specialized sigma24 family protein
MAKTLLSKNELLNLIRAKRTTGAEGLYDQYAAVLRLAIYRIVQQKELTDTLLEQTILKIWDTAALYNEQEVPLLTWMLAIAKSLARESVTADTLPLSA